MELWTSSDGRYSVRLEDTFLLEASRLAREHYPNEVGTPLVGEYTDDGTEARVTALGPLTTDSRGTRFTFSRGVQGLRGFFAGLFSTSRGRVHYVGEWHSHPGGGPFPSATDDANMAAIAEDARAKCPECVLVILAVTPDDARAGVLIYSRMRGRVVLTRKAD
jgi:integrative and conjugative element protein (TIGR02256 family)